jgi:hypothetical protein
VLDGAFDRKLQRPTARPTKPGEGGNSSTLKLAIPVALIPWSPPWIVGILGDSVRPSLQDPKAQVSHDAWITEIQTYLKDNILPDDSASADRITCLAKRYTLVEGDLYRHGTNGILMWCITWEEGCELLVEVHGGECRNHASSRTSVKPSGMASTSLQPSRMLSSW